MKFNEIKAPVISQRITKLEKQIKTEEMIVKKSEEKISILKDELSKWNSIKSRIEKINNDIKSLDGINENTEIEG